jgi:hypothetical protein
MASGDKLRGPRRLSGVVGDMGSLLTTNHADLLEAEASGLPVSERRSGHSVITPRKVFCHPLVTPFLGFVPYSANLEQTVEDISLSLSLS